MPDAIQFICPECGTFHSQWMGFCYACGSGEPLVEAAPSRSAYAPSKNKSTTPFLPTSPGPVELSGVSLDDEPRIVLPFAELNRVLGGGLVPGSVALLAGDPGIGKSTLMLQVAGALAPRVELADKPRGRAVRSGRGIRRANPHARRAARGQRPQPDAVERDRGA